MKKTVLLICFCFFSLYLNPVYAKAPDTIGGFTLGRDINTYGKLLNMDTCRGKRYSSS